MESLTYISQSKMMLVAQILLCSLLPELSLAMGSNSDQVEKIIMRHIQASGGSEALMKMKSISRHGRIRFFDPEKSQKSYCYHTDISYPNKLREQIKSKEILHERATDGAAFWLWTGSEYEFTKDGEIIKYLRDIAERANREMLWLKIESKNFTIAPSPPWAPAASQCIQELNQKDKEKSLYCFNSSTGLLNLIGKWSEEYRLVGDWRWVGRIKIPFRLTHYQNGEAVYEVQLEHAKIDQPIPENTFIKPSVPQFSCQ